MNKMTKKILTVLLIIAVPYILVSSAIRHFGFGTGFGIIVLICAGLFLYFKAPIYTFVGRVKYSKDHDEGFKWLEKAELETLDWAPADIPIVKKIIEE